MIYPHPTTPFLNAHLHDPDDASIQWVEVIDPREPLYGKRLCLERVSRSSPDVANVFLRRDDGVVLRVPLRATSLATLVSDVPRAKLCKQAAEEFLDLVKEYELCPLTNPPRQRVT